jgi:transcriptional regulator with XRE-family HTH domain
MDDIKLNIGEKIMEMRKIRKMTQDDLALKAGMYRANISKIENGITDVRIDTLNRIVQSLDCSIVIVDNKKAAK